MLKQNGIEFLHAGRRNWIDTAKMSKRVNLLLINIVSSIFLGGCVSVPKEGVGEISQFVSDGCSLYPEGPFGVGLAWCDCCVEHDIRYWMGGDSEARMRADDRLKECVAESGHSIRAHWMWWGVRLWGGPYWSTPYRWGYGWQYFRGYVELKPKERRRLEFELENLREHIQTYCRKER